MFLASRVYPELGLIHYDFQLAQGLAQDKPCSEQQNQLQDPQDNIESWGEGRAWIEEAYAKKRQEERVKRLKAIAESFVECENDIQEMLEEIQGVLSTNRGKRKFTIEYMREAREHVRTALREVKG